MFPWRIRGKPRSPATLAPVSTWFVIEHLANTNVECYRYANPLDMDIRSNIDLIQRIQARSRAWLTARTNRNKEQGNLNNNGNLTGWRMHKTPLVDHQL